MPYEDVPCGVNFHKLQDPIYLTYSTPYRIQDLCCVYLQQSISYTVCWKEIDYDQALIGSQTLEPLLTGSIRVHRLHGPNGSQSPGVVWSRDLPKLPLRIIILLEIDKRWQICSISRRKLMEDAFECCVNDNVMVNLGWVSYRFQYINLFRALCRVRPASWNRALNGINYKIHAKYSS